MNPGDVARSRAARQALVALLAATPARRPSLAVSRRTATVTATLVGLALLLWWIAIDGFPFKDYPSW